MLAFADAVASQDWSAAESLTAAGTPASEYVAYRALVRQAQASVGVEPAAGSVVASDEGAGSVTIAMPTDAEPVRFTWTQFVLDGSRHVEGWTTERGPLEDQIRGAGATKEAAGATVGLAAAYVTESDGMYVVVQIGAGDDTVITDLEAALRAPDGEVQASAAMVGPSDVAPGETAYAVYTFPDASLGGDLVYEVQNTVDAPVAVRLPLS